MEDELTFDLESVGRRYHNGLLREPIKHYEDQVRLNQELLDAHASGVMDFSGFGKNFINTLKAANENVLRAIAAYRAKNDRQQAQF